MNVCRRELVSSIGLLILRLGMGGYMATHGLPKMQTLFKGEFDQFGDPLGIGNVASLIGAASAEFVCAMLIVIGLGTRLASIPVVFTMAVAAFVVHKDDPWTMQRAFEKFAAGESEFMASKEPAMVFLFGFLALIFTGPGRFSIDALICRRRGSCAAPDPASAQR